MSRKCQFSPPHSMGCGREAEIEIPEGLPDGSSYYVCREHKLRCFKCSKHAVTSCWRLNGMRICGEPECEDHTHNGEHET